MENTKALEVLRELIDTGFNESGYSEEECAAIIQAATDEATSDLRAKLAERDELIRVLNTTKNELMARCDKYDAQLAAERARMHELLERTYGILENVAIADSSCAEQDAFERETFEDVKRELGK